MPELQEALTAAVNAAVKHAATGLLAAYAGNHMLTHHVMTRSSGNPLDDHAIPDLIRLSSASPWTVNMQQMDMTALERKIVEAVRFAARQPSDNVRHAAIALAAQAPADAEHEAMLRSREFASVDAEADSRSAIETEVQRVQGLEYGVQERIGVKYVEPSSIWEALCFLEGRATRLLRASWLRARHITRMPKRGELPDEAYITVEELQAIYAVAESSWSRLASEMGSDFFSRPMPIISVSHFVSE